MLAFAKEKDKLRYAEKDVKHSKERIRLLLKAEIARMFWNADGLFKVETSTDKEVQIAIKELKKK